MKATDVLLPTDPMPSLGGQLSHDAQQITAADFESGHLLHDAPIRLAGLDHVAHDSQPFFVEPEAVGPATTDAQRRFADLALLHASLGHYARQYWDIQKVRVAMSHRVAAMERDELPEHLIAHARTTTAGLLSLEKDINRYLERSARRHPMADWIRAQRGIGLPGFARLLGITGPLDRFATVSKLWAYLGMHVVEGEAPRRRKGERANWSPQGRVVCHLIGESIVKVGSGPWRAAYDRKKAEYETDRPDWPQLRRHNAAMRYAVKELLKALWIEWHRQPEHVS